MRCVICKDEATGEVRGVRVCEEHLDIMTRLEAQNRVAVTPEKTPELEPELDNKPEPEFKFVPEYKRRKFFYGRRYISTVY